MFVYPLSRRNIFHFLTLGLRLPLKILKLYPASESIDLLEDLHDNGILFTFASDPFTSNTLTVNDLLNDLRSHVEPNKEKIEVEKKKRK